MYMRQRRVTTQGASPDKQHPLTPRRCSTRASTPPPPARTMHTHHNRQQRAWSPTIWQATLVLSAARLLSAAMNIIHDCDEVFNYWEPLHYLLYGYGMQTWEYSQQYALRSYLYPLLHLPVAAPLAALFGAAGGVADAHTTMHSSTYTQPPQASWWCFTQ